MFAFGETGHGYAYRWYIDETISLSPAQGGEATGFYDSPFVAGPAIGGGAMSAPMAMSMGLASVMSGSFELPDAPLTGFQAFGSVALSGSEFTLTEQNDAGIWQPITIPLGAIALKFEYQFIGPAGDGDFVTVDFGDALPLYQALDLEISREVAQPVEVDLTGLTGQTANLVFTLVSRGNPNASVKISNIRFAMSDDQDGDGLSIAQEVSAGSDPTLFDTDGDGIDDGSEISIYGTKPYATDSDADGQSDLAEMRAGTGPTSPGSVFRITGASRDANGFFTVRWPGQPGCTYRVLRSTEIGTFNFDTVVAGLAGSAGEMTWIDSPSPGSARLFYWVEVE